LPTYEYHCDSCDKNFDVVQSFHDDPLISCPTCASPVRKVFGNVGIVFKGSGFYKTDSRKGSSTKAVDGDASTTPTKESESTTSESSNGKPSPAPSDASTKTPPAPPKEKTPSTPATTSGAKSTDSGS
jgi:putative FmdB family regulatory protein